MYKKIILCIIIFLEELINVWYDKDIIEKVVFNLLLNVIKYVLENIEVIFDINKKDDFLLLLLINIY